MRVRTCSMKRGREECVAEPPRASQRLKHPDMWDRIYKWIGKTIMVDGCEFVVERHEVLRLLCFDNEVDVDGKQWYPIAVRNDALLYIDETGEYFKRF
jgi:hypothetical protein